MSRETACGDPPDVPQSLMDTLSDEGRRDDAKGRDEISRTGAERAPEVSAAPDPDLAESIELVRRAQAGDGEVLNRLFGRYQERLHRIARIRMGARLREVMESMDLVQQANEVAVRKIAGFELREHAGIVHWLEKILENQMRDARKGLRAQKRDRDREVPLAELAPTRGEPTGFHPEDRGPTPSQDASRAERELLYDACIEELEPEHREVILLRDYEGGSWEYVCERMGRPNVHATQELHRRARVKLGRIFGQRLGAFGGSGTPQA